MHESKGHIKQVLVQIKNIEMKEIQQFTNELNDPHDPSHCLGAHVNNHRTVNCDIHMCL